MVGAGRVSGPALGGMAVRSGKAGGGQRAAGAVWLWEGLSFHDAATIEPREEAARPRGAVPHGNVLHDGGELERLEVAHAQRHNVDVRLLERGLVGGG